MMEGKVGSKQLQFENLPQGKVGETIVNGQAVRFVRDEQGIWIETPQGFFGYDVRKTMNDDGQAQYALLRRKHAEVVSGVAFLKKGEESDSSASGKVKKGAKVKSQMPGKIIRVLVKAGDTVQKGQPLMVMEAMKMENEIKASIDAVVKEVKVTEGQAVETGAELLSFN